MWQRVPKKLFPEAELRKKLCVASGTDSPDELVFYRDGGDSDSHYLVPRCFDKTPPLYRVYAPPVAPSKIPPNLPVFSGTLLQTDTQPQEEAVAKILETFRKPPYSGILKLPPGCGKTVIAIAAAIRFRQPTLICVHTSVLMEQWCERLRTYAVVGELPIPIGRIRGKVFDIEGKFFVVAMLQTLYRNRHVISPEMFGVVFVDEVHHVVARTYFQAVMNLPIRCVMGLSATPKRTDLPALNRILRYVMGEVIFEVAGAGAATGVANNPNPHEAQILIHHSESPICRKTFSSPEQARFKYLQEMTLDRIRNLGVITRLVERLRREPSRQVLVLSHYVDHLNTLEALFQQVWREAPVSSVTLATLVTPTTGVVHGKVKLKLRAEIFRDRQVLFSTYNLFKEGGDIPRLDTLVLTLPAGNIIQTAGRIMRGGGGNTANAKLNAKLILAIYNDNTYPGFATFDHLRRSHEQYFRKNGFEVQQSTLVEPETDANVNHNS